MSEKRKILTVTTSTVVVIQLLPRAFKMMQAGSVNAKRFWDAFHKNFTPKSSTEEWVDFFSDLIM